MTEPSVDDFMANWQAQRAAQAMLAAETRPANKTALFDVLASAGITRVTVHFDGYGDSGQIEDITAQANGAPVELPASEIEINSLLPDGSGVERHTLPIREAIERLAYDFLEESHGGWENNEGGFGDFHFDVAEREITLEYSERIESTEYYEHQF